MSHKATNGLDRRSVLKMTGAGLTSSLLAGCLAGDSNGNQTTDGGPITISVLEPLSGPFAVYGPRHRKGAEFAKEKINANGGVLGRKLNLEVADTENSPQTAASAFTDHIDAQGAVVGIGAPASEVAIQVRSVAESRKIPFFFYASGAVDVIPKDSRYSFRTDLPATPTVGRAQGKMIEEGGYNNIGVIYEDGVWGDEYEASVKEYFPDNVNITADTAPITQTDFVPILRKFPDDIEVFLGTGHPAGANSIYSQLHSLGKEPELYPAAINSMVVDYQAIGEKIGQSFASFNSTDMYSDEYRQIATEWNEKYGGLFDHSQVSGYNEVYMVKQAIEMAGSTDPTAIAEATRTGKFDNPLFAYDIEYTKWGEPKNSVMVYNGFDVDSAPEYWPNGSFAPVEVYRTDPMPAFEPGSLGLVSD